MFEIIIHIFLQWLKIIVFLTIFVIEIFVIDKIIKFITLSEEKLRV